MTYTPCPDRRESFSGFPPGRSYGTGPPPHFLRKCCGAPLPPGIGLHNPGALSLSTTFCYRGAESAGPGSAPPVRTAASPPSFYFPQEASTHINPDKILNAGQLVPKISGCCGLTATSTLCFCHRNWIAKSNTG